MDSHATLGTMGSTRTLGDLLRTTKHATETKVGSRFDDCCPEVTRAQVPATRLLLGKFEVNWLELVWLGKRERKNSDGHLCGDAQGVRKFRTIRQQPETAR